ATARTVFETGGPTGQARGLAAHGGELPRVALPRDALERGMPAFELFVKSGLAASNGAARRLIKGCRARITDAVVGAGLQPRRRSKWACPISACATSRPPPTPPAPSAF